MKLGLLFIGGVVIGWLGMSLGFAQTWWPISVSGAAENVIAGKLSPSGTFSDRFEIQSEAGNILVDMGSLSEKKYAAIAGRQAIVRGKLSNNNPKLSGISEDINEIMETTWLWALPW